MAAVNIYKQVRGRLFYKRIEYRLSVLRAFAEAGALSLYGGKSLKKELIFIDEETLTPEELEAIADEYETEE